MTAETIKKNSSNFNIRILERKIFWIIWEDYKVLACIVCLWKWKCS